MKIKKGQHEFHFTLDEFLELLDDDEQFEEILADLKYLDAEETGGFFMIVDADGTMPFYDDEYDDAYDELYQPEEYEFSYVDEEDEDEFDLFNPNFINTAIPQFIDGNLLYVDEPNEKMKRCLYVLKQNGFISED